MRGPLRTCKGRGKGLCNGSSKGFCKGARKGLSTADYVPVAVLTGSAAEVLSSAKSRSNPARRPASCAGDAPARRDR